MKLTNNELLLMNYALEDLLTQKIKGAVKFKFLKLANELERALEPAMKAMADATTEEQKEITEAVQDIQLPQFTEEELEPVEMNLEQLILLKKLIKEEE